MSEKLGEIDYTEDAYLYPGAEYEDIYDNSIELNIIEKRLDILEDKALEKAEGSTEKSEDRLELEDMKNAEVEAYFIVDKIKNLIGKKTYDAKSKSYREIRYRDIVILLRAMKNWGNIYEEIFIKEGIPIYLDDSSGYFDAIEIKISLNLLSIIDNTRQDIPLLSVMRSMIGGFTLEELIAIRIADRTGSYYKAIYRYMEEFNDELSQKLKTFMQNIEEWKRQSRYYKLDEFIWKLLADTNYYNYVGGMVNGEQRQANLTMLVDRANEFERGSINGLFNFIRFSDKLKDISGDMGTAKTIGESENVVRLMSIHKSKGLEFPVVICGGLGKEFNTRDSKGELVFHKNLGIAMRYVDLERRKYNSSFPELAIKNRLKIESLSEELRILYVAFTRAKDKLILFGVVNDIEKKVPKWFRDTTVYNLQKAKSFMDWIGMAISKHPRARVQLEQELGLEVSEKNSIEDESSWSIKLHSKRDIVEREMDKSKKKQEKRERLEEYKSQNGELREEIERRFNWKYPFDAEAQTPSKVSVTQIKNIGKSSVEYIKLPELQEVPEFLRKESGYTSAERGTINHRIFEMLDFKSSWDMESMETQIDRFVEEGVLNLEEANLIDKEGILSFFESDLYSRILGSRTVRKEQSFVYKKEKDQEFYIQGIIDCYFEEKEGIVLVDYKTDTIDDESKLRSRYAEQVEMYSEAIESITGKSVIGKYIYSTYLQKQIEV